MDLSRVGKGDRRGAGGHGRTTAQLAKTHAKEKDGIEEEKPLEGAPLATALQGHRR